jgi:hypothetical protein
MFKKVPVENFSGIAAIVMPGEEVPGLIDFKFRYLKRKAFNTLMADVRAGTKTESEMLQGLIVSWDEKAKDSLVTEPYTVDTLDDLIDTFWDAAAAIMRAYMKGAGEARIKN